MEKSDFLFRFIEIIAFCLPVGTLIWKAANQAARLQTLEEEHKELKLIVAQNEIKIDKVLSTIETNLSQLNLKINSIETSIKYIEKSIPQK